MPTPDLIRANLRLISNEAIVLAVVWHALALAGLLALLLGRRPQKRWAGVLASMPILSVSALAFLYANPFNGTSFGVLAAVLVGTSLRFDVAPVPPSSTLEKTLGAAMVVFGWTYPHFLESRPAVTYLYAAPLGLVPCPTLALVTGFALLLGRLGSKSWSAALGTAGLFYGLFGVLRLGVVLDLGLVIGAAALLVLTLRGQAGISRNVASHA